ncbi:MAG: efflux RND transporter permease subunit, partial [Planctomycetota bacterium]
MNAEDSQELSLEQKSPIGRLIKFFLTNRLLVLFIILAILASGLMVAPFDWSSSTVQRYPVPVDAIPDIGENQQIVFTEWLGRSPQDIEDQITYPLTVQLLGIPGVKTIRSYSMFGFSTLYIIFKEDVEFYWSRSRVLEKINSLSPGMLPAGVKPALGPDSTALGQIYWYTLEGLDKNGNPTGGWDLEELRNIQDWYVRYWLMAADGVSEVGSIGGYVKEYQVDVDPDAMRAYGVSVEEVYAAVRNANIDVGAKSIEVNRTEYFIRGIGFIKNLQDIENSVIKVRSNNIPVLIKHVAGVSVGPAVRRGALDKGGAQVAGGVVVARYGANPLKVISNVKQKISETAASLPVKAVIDWQKTTSEEVAAFAADNGFPVYVSGVLNQNAWTEYLQKTPADKHPGWLTLSRVTVVPFYDRTGLIYETLGTLDEAITLEILITVIVVLVMVMHFRSGIIVSSMLPLAVLLSFVAMKLFKVQANIVALSGIAIAIGTIVDMGIVICENILKHLEEALPEESKINVIHRAASEVGSAVFTAVLTTVVSFLPVFTMIGAEGKLFKPLAFTKTFALLASIIIALVILPAASNLFFCAKPQNEKIKKIFYLILSAAGIITALGYSAPVGIIILAYGLYQIYEADIPERLKGRESRFLIYFSVFVVGCYLTAAWEPVGPDKGFIRNLFFVFLLLGVILGLLKLFQHHYSNLLSWCLENKAKFLALPCILLIAGLTIWLGFAQTFSWLPGSSTAPAKKIA